MTCGCVGTRRRCRLPTTASDASLCKRSRQVCFLSFSLLPPRPFILFLPRTASLSQRKHKNGLLSWPFRPSALYRLKNDESSGGGAWQQQWRLIWERAHLPSFPTGVYFLCHSVPCGPRYHSLSSNRFRCFLQYAGFRVARLQWVYSFR